jgi:hypothetical protein
MLKLFNYLPIASMALFLFSATAFSADPEFSLHNKSKFPIKLLLTNDKNEVSDTIEPGKFLNRAININSYTTVKITHEHSKFPYIVAFPKGKTIYINWDDKHIPQLYHQRGPWLGLTRKTDLGFSTANNIKDSDIVRLLKEALDAPAP